MADGKQNTFVIPKPSPDLFRKRSTEDFGHIGMQVEQTFSPDTMRDKYRVSDPSTGRYAIAEVDEAYAMDQRATEELMRRMMREVYGPDDKCGNPGCDLCGNGGGRQRQQDYYSFGQRYMTGAEAQVQWRDPAPRPGPRPQECENCKRKDEEIGRLRLNASQAVTARQAEAQQIKDEHDAEVISLTERLEALQIERDALDQEANHLAAEYARAMTEIEYLRGVANAA